MNPKCRVLAVATFVALFAASAAAQNIETFPPAVTSAPAEDVEARYTAAIEKRTADILALLELTDTNKISRVHDTIMAQYRGLKAWHAANAANLKALNKQATNNATAIAEIKASLKTVHDQFLARLATDLTPAQVDKVKDKMTYGKVKVTYDAYIEIVPGITEEEKAKMMELLKEAREEAMDAGSSGEKDAIFGKAKGKINNYLSKQGYDIGKARKEWAAKKNAQQAEKAKAAEEAAPAAK